MRSRQIGHRGMTGKRDAATVATLCNQIFCFGTFKLSARDRDEQSSQASRMRLMSSVKRSGIQRRSGSI